MMTVTNKNKPIKRIVVVSSTKENRASCYLHGWQSALVLAEQLQGMAIEVVHLCQPNSLNNSDSRKQNHNQSQNHNNNHVVTINEQQLAFHHQLGLSEKSLIAKAQGSFTLATQFIGWQQEVQSFYHGDAPRGFEFDSVEFQHHLARLQLESAYKPVIDDFSLSSACAKQGTFSHPVNDKSSIKSTLAYRINLASDKYA